MYASMLTLRVLHGLCNAWYLELSLHLIEFCKSVLLLCTDSPIRELQLSRHVFTWLEVKQMSSETLGECKEHKLFSAATSCFTFELATQRENMQPARDSSPCGFHT